MDGVTEELDEVLILVLMEDALRERFLKKYNLSIFKS